MQIKKKTQNLMRFSQILTKSFDADNQFTITKLQIIIITDKLETPPLKNRRTFPNPKNSKITI